MANRYWVGGSGTWDTTSTTHWATTSGGAGGASVPTIADAVIFDSASITGGSYTVTLQSGVTLSCASLSMSSASGTGAITTSGTTLNCAGSIAISGSGNSVVLGASTVYCTSWAIGTSPALSAANATIVLNAGTTASFSGGDKTYGTLLIANDSVTSTTTVTGNNTITSLRSTKTVAHSIVFPYNGTTTVSTWGLAGSAGALASIRSSSSTRKTNLVYSGAGVVSTDYIYANDVAASPANTWYLGTHSVDGLDNTGLIFTNPPYVKSSLFFGCNF